jgi:hypothetical protein
MRLISCCLLAGALPAAAVQRLECPVGYNASTRNVDGAGKRFENVANISECARICDERAGEDGCRQFEYSFSGRELGRCGTYNKFGFATPFQRQRSGWQTCARPLFCRAIGEGCAIDLDCCTNSCFGGFCAFNFDDNSFVRARLDGLDAFCTPGTQSCAQDVAECCVGGESANGTFGRCPASGRCPVFRPFSESTFLP